MIKLKTYKAQEGDAFLLSLGEDFNILVDMGVSETYEKHIKADLIALSAKGKKIDLLIITHIDNDHINGAVKFINDNGSNSRIIEVEEIWHNSYRHLQFNKTKTKRLGEDEKNILSELISQNTRSSTDNGISDVGFSEGSTFASLLYKHNYHWNLSSAGMAVCIESMPVFSKGDLKIRLLSPNKQKLEKLAAKWEDELDSLLYNFNLSEDTIFDDAFELYVQNIKDESNITTDCSSSSFDILKLAGHIDEYEYRANNGSSIAFILEFKTKKILLLGDAHENIVYNSLNQLKSEGYELKFDLVKVSHHGSRKNISNRLLKIIDSTIFLISTNGKRHSHPNLEAIAKIATKETDYKKYIIFNYEISKLAPFKDKELQKKYKYELKFKNDIII